MVNASLTAAARFSSSEAVPARTRATAWVPAAVPRVQGAVDHIDELRHFPGVRLGEPAPP